MSSIPPTHKAIKALFFDRLENVIGRKTSFDELRKMVAIGLTANMALFQTEYGMTASVIGQPNTLSVFKSIMSKYLADNNNNFISINV